MNKIFYELYVKSIRKVLKLDAVKSFIIAYFPKLQSVSESIYVRYKDAESNLLDIFCDKSKISLDIGTLWGGYTILLKKYSSKVYSFEPNTENYNFLIRSFQNDSKIKIINSAVSNIDGTVTFRVPKGSPGNATIAKENDLENFANIIEYNVPTLALDNMDLNNIGFIKIDIEGHEYAALKGMQNLLKEQKPVLLIEIEERHNKGAISNVLSFLKTLDYNSYYLINETLFSVENFNVENLQNPVNRNTNKYINNFIFIPIESNELLLSNLKRRGIKTDFS